MTMSGPESHREAGLILESDRCSYGCPHTGCPHETAMLAAAVVYSLRALTAAVIATGAHKLGPADRHEWLTATDPEYAAEQATEITTAGQQPCRAHPDDCPWGPEPHTYHPPENEGLPCCVQPGEES